MNFLDQNKSLPCLCIRMKTTALKYMKYFFYLFVFDNCFEKFVDDKSQKIQEFIQLKQLFNSTPFHLII